jgi:hypothetical protein
VASSYAWITLREVALEEIVPWGVWESKVVLKGGV